MEGILLKWTNYFSGWQSRWFLLENDILSYYKSQDDMKNGCKGSVRMSVCDVNVHTTDATRLDLIIPGEAHFYVKAPSPKERQQWLVALGSCKAGIINSNVTSNHALEEPPLSEDALKSKKSELRLYCDLLMQQVHNVKNVANSPDGVNGENLDDATSLLSETCDTFITALEDCMELVHAKQPPSPNPNGPSSPSRRVSNASVNSLPLSSRPPNLQRAMSMDRYLPATARVARSQRAVQRMHSTSESSELPPTIRMNGDNGMDNGHDEPQINTMFTNMSSSFTDIHLLANGGVPVLPFLESCRNILTVFDKFNSHAFAPVKLDVAGNIRKIQQKYSTDVDNFPTLQSIVLYELQQKHNQKTNSATMALLWLKRAVEFVMELLSELLHGVQDLEEAANTAYSKTLKPYHSYVVRGIYSMAVKDAPSRETFFSLLLDNPSSSEDLTLLHSELLKQIETYVSALGVVVKILQDFYTTHELDSPQQI